MLLSISRRLKTGWNLIIIIIIIITAPHQQGVFVFHSVGPRLGPLGI
jgi:hypothetical protein